MRHYELMLLIHPDQSEHVPAIGDRYRKMVSDSKGKTHRYEDWGRRPLAYRVAHAQKGHYLLLNIECDQETLTEIKESLNLNEYVLRYLVVRTEKAQTAPTPYTLALNSKRHEKSAKGDERERSEDGDAETDDKADKADDKTDKKASAKADKADKASAKADKTAKTADKADDKAEAGDDDKAAEPTKADSDKSNVEEKV